MRLIADALNAGCGIFRDEQALGQSVDTIAGILDSGRSESRPDVITRSARVALSIAESARRRRESRGDHFRTDHPRRDDSRWLTNQTVALDEAGGLVFRSGTGITERASSETKSPE
jgi:succinate dehydrogenase/fumarate reductase flavoprotein subunit